MYLYTLQATKDAFDTFTKIRKFDTHFRKTRSTKTMTKTIY